MEPFDIRRLGADDLDVIARIDRSEHVELEYRVLDGELIERPITMADIPRWDPVGTGPFSVAAQIAFCEPVVAGGAAFLAAFDRDDPAGVVVVDPVFEPPMAWLAYLHVSRPHRRRGVATALWTAAADVAIASGATSMYVSAVPTGSAIGFYLGRGCELAHRPHPKLYELEPDDVHLVCALQ